MRVFMDENSNLYTAMFIPSQGTWVVWNKEHDFLAFVPNSEAAKLLQDLGEL